MINGETGNEMTEQELLKEAADCVAGACELLFETESSEGHMLAFMADSLLKLLSVTIHEEHVLLAAADYQAFEQKVYNKKHGIEEQETEDEV